MTPDDQLAIAVARLRTLADKLDGGEAYLDWIEYCEQDGRGRAFHRIRLEVSVLVPVRNAERVIRDER